MFAAHVKLRIVKLREERVAAWSCAARPCLTGRSDPWCREAGSVWQALSGGRWNWPFADLCQAVCFAFRILESSESCSTINQHVLVVTQNLWLAEPDRFVFCCANFPHLCFFVMHMILFAIYRYILCTETVQNHSCSFALQSALRSLCPCQALSKEKAAITAVLQTCLEKARNTRKKPRFEWHLLSLKLIWTRLQVNCQLERGEEICQKVACQRVWVTIIGEGSWVRGNHECPFQSHS